RDERRAALRSVAVGEGQVVRSANLATRDFLAVDENDHRRRGFHAARIQAGVDAVAFEEVDAVLAVGREDVRKAHAAASAERIAVLVKVLSDRAEAGLPAAAPSAAGKH